MLTEEITLRLVKEIKRFLLEDALALSRSSDEQLMVRIKEIIDHKLVHYEITPQEREKIARRVFSSLRGLGILDELLNDYHITYDSEKFVVEYVPNGSNLLPSISVLPVNARKGGAR